MNKESTFSLLPRLWESTERLHGQKFDGKTQIFFPWNGFITFCRLGSIVEWSEAPSASTTSATQILFVGTAFMANLNIIVEKNEPKFAWIPFEQSKKSEHASVVT